MAHYAVKETKTIQTRNDTSLIDQMNKREELFFWNVQSVQVTHVQDSHTEFRDKAFMNAIEVSTVTETTQYATITYERDKMIPLYDEVVELEKEYCAIEDTIRGNYARQRYPSIILGILIPPLLIYVIYMRFVHNPKIEQHVRSELYPKLEQKEKEARAMYSRVLGAMRG